VTAADERTLVTGANGFVGSHLLDRIIGRGPVVAWFYPEGPPPPAAPGLEWRAVDVTDRAAVARAVADAAPSRVVHLAGAPNVAASWQGVVPYLLINAMGTDHLLSALAAAGRPCRVVVVTSSQVYQSSADPIDENAPLVPSSPYGFSKLAQDELARAIADSENLDVVVARPFNHTGPRQTASYAVPSFARQIARIELGLAPPVLRVGNLDTRRDLTDVRDVVGAYETVLDRAPRGRVYNVCSGRAWRIQDLLDMLLRMSHTDVRVETDGARMRPNDLPTSVGDGSRIRAEIGWTPVIPIEQTLRDTLDWWRGEARAGR